MHFSINLRADRQEQENIRGGTQGAANASVLLDQGPWWCLFHSRTKRLCMKRATKKVVGSHPQGT
jgi:hypothetical protein